MVMRANNGDAFDDAVAEVGVKDCGVVSGAVGDNNDGADDVDDDVDDGADVGYDHDACVDHLVDVDNDKILILTFMIVDAGGGNGDYVDVVVYVDDDEYAAGVADDVDDDADCC